MKATLPVGYFDMGLAELQALPIETLRAVYDAHEERAGYFVGRAEARAQARALNPRDGVAWVLAIRTVTCKCDHCNGSGTYYWGACVNGKMTHSGPCFRCGRKGWLNFDDMRRCNIYDRYAIARAFGC